MNNREKITELAEKAALEHLKKNNCPECCGSSYNSFLSGVAWKACEHEGWPVQKGGVIPDCSICGIPFDVFYAQERPLGSLFSHELQNNVPQWVKDFVDEEFPEEHYGGIEGYFEAWPLRNIFEQMVTLALVKVGGETSPAVRSLKTLVDRFLAWPLPKSVNADLCATDNAYPHQRSGTNLLNATEAEEMFKYVLASHVPTAQCDSEAAGSGNQHSPKGAEDVGNKPASGSSPSPAAEGISKDTVVWMLEPTNGKGLLCLGECNKRLKWTTFTSDQALKFDTKEKAEAFAKEQGLGNVEARDHMFMAGPQS